MYKYFLSLVVFISCVYADITPYSILPSSHGPQQQHIKILDSVKLNFHSFFGTKVRELSDIAYRENILYSIGDRGVLYKFSIKIADDKIKKLRLLKATVLKGKDKKSLSKSQRDSEGLDFKGKYLLVSFEKEPRVELRKLNAKKYKTVKIEKKLQHIKNYQSENKALESVAYSKKYGVVTAPELPLYGKNEHKIYSLHRSWKFPQEGGITSLTFINKNEIMILQRKHTFFNFRTEITLSKLNLKTKKYTILARFDSKDGWKIDNFEGLTKVGKNRYLMISDDNNSFLQKTLLVLFEIVK